MFNFSFVSLISFVSYFSLVLNEPLGINSGTPGIFGLKDKESFMMENFNPYIVDEVVAETDAKASVFGLIGSDEPNGSELHGYEVTMSGRLVTPEFHPQIEDDNQRSS
jgi:hypothetical protein